MSESIKLLGEIRDELKAIRELLAAAPRPAAPRAATSSASSASPSNFEAPPQPSQIIDNPAGVKVHFGKNNGVPLGELSERSIAFYASVKEPRLDGQGNPYPPRPVDVALENAARQLYHTLKGTLGATPAPAPAAAPAASGRPSRAPAATTPAPAAQQESIDDEEIPF